uniref:Si:ch73-314g15.3 n=2 Tax=Lepisosteus oculatus TaxID=7918 RepID=W5N9U7_LEPOC
MDHFEEDLVNALKDVVNCSSWQCLGGKYLFKSKCTKLYSEDGEDIVLVHIGDDQFWAMDSACPHEGGPLDLGDIEDLGNGKLALICPWHHFDFCLETGISSTGLQNQVYEVRVFNGNIYIHTQNMLSLSPIHEKTAASSGRLPPEILPDPSEDTLCFWAAKILCTADPKEKVALTQEVQGRWNSGKITEVGQAVPPEQPSRQESLTVLQPGKIKRGKGGTLASRIALLHSLANIEQWAIDLSWDIIARFSTVRLGSGEPLPLQFFSDFVKVAGDEAKHYDLLEQRITELGSFFGALPVHNGLWQSASETAHDLLARLAIVHMVHEARGLDVHPQTLSRFAAQGDQSSVKALEVIYADEITHVAAGLRWFTYICTKERRDCLSTFHELVKQHFQGYLKPPFNIEGRKTAGMTEEWYLPLVKPS